MIHQINMQFDPEQDRIVFRLSTIQKEEMRFYFTRRYVKLLWPALQHLLENEYKARNPDKAHLVQTLAPIEHQEALAGANFSSQYSEDVRRFPLGEEIILLSGIRVKEGNILCMHPSKGKGIEIKIDYRLLHSFMEILVQTVKKAGWELDALINQVGQNIQTEPTGHTIH